MGGLTRGPFQAESVCVVSDDSGPLGPSDFCLWEGVTATYSDCVGKTDLWPGLCETDLVAAAPQSGSFCLFRPHFIDPCLPLFSFRPPRGSLWLLGIQAGKYRTLGHWLPTAASWLSYTQLHEPLSDSASPVLEGRPQSSVTRFSHLMWASLHAGDGEGKRFPLIVAGLRGSL